jgi:hypothetical protein
LSVSAENVSIKLSIEPSKCQSLMKPNTKQASLTIQGWYPKNF